MLPFSVADLFEGRLRPEVERVFALCREGDTPREEVAAEQQGADDAAAPR